MNESLINKVVIGLIFFIILFSLVARFYDLTKDTYSTQKYGIPPEDEGSYLNNARNKVLFGEWKLDFDFWNSMYISPTFTFFEYISFKVLGVSIFAARITPALFGMISILIASFLIFKRNREEGAIYFILLIINIFLIAYSRVGLLEYAVLFFIVMSLGLIYYNSKYSWILVGILAPCLFFTKLTTMFFILAVPSSLILYYLIYKDKKTLKNAYYYFFGVIISSFFWLFWLIPNLEGWIFSNFGLSGKISLLDLSLLGPAYSFYQFFLKVPIISILVIVSIFLTIKMIINKERIRFIDFFLIISLILLYFQLSFFDMYLRRYVMVIPILLLIAARFISRIGDLNVNYHNKIYSIKKSMIIYLIVLTYVLFNAGQIGAYFFESYIDYESAHSRIRVSKQIGEIIPDGAAVYGRGYEFSLENGIKFFYPYSENVFIEDFEETTLDLFAKADIEYIILRLNIFDESATKPMKPKYILSNEKLLEHIKNNFKIIAQLKSRDSYTNFGDEIIYIYKKITPDS